MTDKDALVPQYIYMELCKDSSPLPAERLSTIEAITEVIDKQELKKALARTIFKLKLADGKDKLDEFCSDMAATIKNEPKPEQ
jgi:hypothetical protein